MSLHFSSPGAATGKGLRVWHVEPNHVALSFVALSVGTSIICPNTVFPLLPDGGVRTRVSTARKGVLEGLYSSASALWVNAGRFIGISPPFMFFFPLFIFAGAQENQTNPKPQIFVIV